LTATGATIGITNSSYAPASSVWIWSPQTLTARFKNVMPEGKGKRRSYGLHSMDAEAVERVIQLLRAFVRPTHGEILVIRMDSHPSHRSKHISDYASESGILWIWRLSREVVKA
jgi:hypothetical protein